MVLSELSSMIFLAKCLHAVVAITVTGRSIRPPMMCFLPPCVFRYVVEPLYLHNSRAKRS